MDKKKQYFIDGILPLCPVCGRELDQSLSSGKGWKCRCGEFIPEDLALNPFEGCTHGLNCNCNREKKR
jgi:tRNA(Ile2) C34 agmatinyltransferase TiaS